jgi:hypothetical protein
LLEYSEPQYLHLAPYLIFLPFLFPLTAMPTVVGVGPSMLVAALAPVTAPSAPASSPIAPPSPKRSMTPVTAPTRCHRRASSFKVQGVLEVGVSVSISDHPSPQQLGFLRFLNGDGHTHEHNSIVDVDLPDNIRMGC